MHVYNNINRSLKKEASDRIRLQTTLFQFTIVCIYKYTQILNLFNIYTTKAKEILGESVGVEERERERDRTNTVIVTARGNRDFIN